MSVHYLAMKWRAHILSVVDFFDVVGTVTTTVVICDRIWRTLHSFDQRWWRGWRDTGRRPLRWPVLAVATARNVAITLGVILRSRRSVWMMVTRRVVVISAGFVVNIVGRAIGPHRDAVNGQLDNQWVETTWNPEIRSPSLQDWYWHYRIVDAKKIGMAMNKYENEEIIKKYRGLALDESQAIKRKTSWVSLLPRCEATEVE